MKLDFEGVTAAYGGKTVLEDVGFAVPEGSITVLTGANGIGKSTLIRCLMGEKRDYSGKIALDGQDVRSMDRICRAQSLACLPQTLPQPHVTVRELVSFGRTPYTPLTGVLSEADTDRVRWAMVAVGIAGFGEAFVDRLSGGEAKKAFFAMTLAQDTPVVVLDEPAAHLDMASRFAFLDLLDALRRQTGKTFLLVMHELPEVLRCADRIVTLHGKHVAFEGTAAECLAAGIPERCFGIRITGEKAGGYAAVPVK